jgi:thiosulfate/3-mercaptopyruvate sulfurtransferase
MKAGFTIIILFSVGFLLSGFVKLSGGNDPWTAKQLMEPSELIKIKDEKREEVFIYNLGPAGTIKGSVMIGSTSQKENLEKFQSALKEVPKDKKIVIYCGCCPFENCPNIRPAFSLLNELKFSNIYLINLPNNLKIDWIDKGYTLEKE